ncbi:V-type ATP synthase subunit K [Candidatus Woesearchaeota archaeon CG_4_10_14_0_2_um_filter_57_5]|nr:MAG: V-type ATP synthase subunit K [Candidatus Woesearchaeota archaeon CG_4_10_14_0_2_um_filter_57_5]
MAVDWTTAFVALSAAGTISVTGLAAAWAEKTLGAAAIGAMAEKESLFGKGLIITVLPETIVIFGLVVAILILGLASPA